MTTTTFKPLIIVFLKQEGVCLAEVFTRTVLPPLQQGSRIRFREDQLPFKEGRYFMSSCLTRFDLTT